MMQTARQIAEAIGAQLEGDGAFDLRFTEPACADEYEEAGDYA